MKGKIWANKRDIRELKKKKRGASNNQSYGTINFAVSWYSALEDLNPTPQNNLLRLQMSWEANGTLHMNAYIER